MAEGGVLHLCLVGVLATLLSGCSGQCYTGQANLEADDIWREIRLPVDYTGNYASYLQCAWMIHAHYGSKVKVRVDFVDIESSGRTCPFDYVSIYDGYSSGSPRIAKFCSDDVEGSSFCSSGQYMSVYFNSDGSVEGKGFTLYYKAAPPSETEQCTTADHQWWDTTTLSITTFSSSDSRDSFSAMGLVAGLLGSLVMLFFLILACRYCYYRSSRQTQSRTTTAFTTQAAGPSTSPSSPYTSPNGVFMVSRDGVAPSAPYGGGNTNLAYTPTWGPPPSYETLAPPTPVTPPTQPTAPPSYGEAIQMINTNGDASLAPKPE